MTKTWHRPTLWLAVVMTALTAVALGGLLLDDRVLQDSPVWLKPFKFAVSLALYSITLSWLLSLPHKGKRWTSGLATTIAVIMLLDVGLVAAQAARGQFSHFNTSDDPFTRLVQAAFATTIPVMFLANVALALIMAGQRLGDRSLALAVRGGLGLAVLGMASGYLMVFANRGRRSAVPDAAGNVVQLSGGHTVGAPDGGAGLPVTAWSTTGGDLRIPHFVGMHGLQVVLLLALGLTALGVAERTRARLVLVAVAGYTGLFGLLTWQALRGEPLLRPGAAVLAALVVLAAATAAGVAWALRDAAAAPGPVRPPVLRR
ncbi:hypothetical protein [Saccharothrix coeruleofusca]|uniref:Uncharacterized protein n=1 Tax=Saccharothrix coeruleofusca TaxID=33919 RepID=A0A918ECE0_9PSEU|nr:hypothetical protein [Saccharothrix coeruleofusca]MBP2338451.1 hypothetical protein [Saccharothrix coeruleofusca]GGP48274.1 hypothetical protein GCM10010185_20320 [Saccharothrix coeruleofusca]